MSTSFERQSPARVDWCQINHNWTYNWTTISFTDEPEFEFFQILDPSFMQAQFGPLNTW